MGLTSGRATVGTERYSATNTSKTSALTESYTTINPLTAHSFTPDISTETTKATASEPAQSSGLRSQSTFSGPETSTSLNRAESSTELLGNTEATGMDSSTTDVPEGEGSTAAYEGTSVESSTSAATKRESEVSSSTAKSTTNASSRAEGKTASSPSSHASSEGDSTYSDGSTLQASSQSTPEDLSSSTIPEYSSSPTEEDLSPSTRPEDSFSSSTPEDFSPYASPEDLSKASDTSVVSPVSLTQWTDATMTPEMKITAAQSASNPSTSTSMETGPSASESSYETDTSTAEWPSSSSTEQAMGSSDASSSESSTSPKTPLASSDASPSPGLTTTPSEVEESSQSPTQALLTEAATMSIQPATVNGGVSGSSTAAGSTLPKITTATGKLSPVTSAAETTSAWEVSSTILSSSAVAAIEAYAGEPIPGQVLTAVNEGNSSALTSWLDGVEPPPTPLDLELLEEDAVESGVPEDILDVIQEQNRATQVQSALEVFLDGAEVDTDTAKALMAGNTTGLSELIQSLPEKPTQHDFDKLAKATKHILSQDILKELEDMLLFTTSPPPGSKYFSPEDIAAMEEYAGESLPAEVLDALAEGNTSSLSEWLDSLEPQPTAENLKTFEKAAEGVGLAEDIVDTVKAQSRRAQLTSALEEFTNTSNIDDGIVEALISGNASGLQDLIQTLPVQPSKADFEKLIEETQGILSTAGQKALGDLLKESIPLSDSTVAAMERFAGEPLPGDVAQAFAKGEQGRVAAWLDSLSPAPSEQAIDGLLADDDVPGAVRDMVKAWAEPPATTAPMTTTQAPETTSKAPMTASEAEGAARRVGAALGKTVPREVVERLKEGQPDALSYWLADEGVLPTDEQWRRMDLPSLPTEVREDMEDYQQVQDDLEAIGKLAGMTPKELPVNLTGPFLSSGDAGPLLDWLERQGVRPTPGDWDELDKDSSVSQKTRAQLAEFRERICQGDFAGEWGDWTPCPVTCGRGNKTRLRERLEAGCAAVETLYCNRPFCPLDCEWGQWGAWGSCSQSCGTGKKTRYRRHETEVSEFGARCVGPNVEAKECTGDECVDPTAPPEVVAGLAQAGIDIEDAKESAAFATAALDTIPFLIGNLSLEEKMGLGHTLDGTVSLCAYNGVRCPKEDFKTFYDESLGNCFTFNYPEPAKYEAKRPGATTGLTMLLASQQSEYLCTSQLGGFKLMIHNQTERPFADSMGFNVAPSKTTLVSLSQALLTPTGPPGAFSDAEPSVQVELRKQPPPYGGCTMNKNQDYLYNGSHTMEGCLRSCYQKKLTELCGCADPRYTIPEGEKVCGVDMKLRLDYYRNCRDGSGGENPMACEHCSNPCQSYLYQLTTSSGVMKDSDIYSTICAANYADPGAATECHSADLMKRNFALVKVYYERMNLVRHEEIPDYAMSNLVSDFAGVLGICMGASVLTMAEFLAALIGIVAHKLSRHSLSIF